MSINEFEKIKNKAISFLSKNKMYFNDINIQKYIDIFLCEMKKGLENKPGSIEMIPSFITIENNSFRNRPVLVIDAGGTNLRSAVVTLSDGKKPLIQNFKQTVIPGTKDLVSKDIFFETIVENISDSINASEIISFVFSYPAEIFPNKDGRLIKFNKGIKAPEVEGEFIGKNLLQMIDVKGFNPNKKIIILNDTVALLLSGIESLHRREFDSYIGFVLGTGLNASYIEKNINIKKLKMEKLNLEEYQIINTEAGLMSKGPNGRIDQKLDARTMFPGKELYQKMFSGAYFGNLVLEVLKTAADENLFSARINGIIKDLTILESKDIDEYLNYPPFYSSINSYFGEMDEKDKVLFYFLFDAMIERAALLSAIIIASIIIKIQKGKNPCRPVCIIAEGSAFYKMKNFQSRVERYLYEVLTRRKGYYFEIHKVDNSIMIGAALAGLCK